MNINEIFTEVEYTKKRTARELFDFFEKKNKELSTWNPNHPDIKKRREIRYRELDKGLPKKFRLELIPFAYYANTYYNDKPEVLFIPCCRSQQYDGIIIDNDMEIYVEIANASLNYKWGLQKELLIENGQTPWMHNILGVEENKTKMKRKTSDIIITNELFGSPELIRTAKELVKTTAKNKCEKSIRPTLPYGKNKTVLLISFDDTGFNETDRNVFINFKRLEIDKMSHSFIKIMLFGWISKTFMS